MSEQEQNLKDTQLNIHNSKISDKERKIIFVGIRILFVLIIILTGFIFEALSNQHPVFEFLPYKIFKQESIIIGSIALVFAFIGYLVIGIALGNAILANFEFKKAIYLTNLIGIILFITSFVMLYKSYNWELGSLKYFSYPLLITGITGSLVVGVIQKSKYVLFPKKILRIIFNILYFLGLFIIIYS